MQYDPDFFHYYRPNHLNSLLPRVTCRQKALNRLPRFGRIIFTNLVLNYLQDRCFQVRIMCCLLNIWLIGSSGSSARPTVLLSLTSHFSDFLSYGNY